MHVAATPRASPNAICTSFTRRLCTRLDNPETTRGTLPRVNGSVATHEKAVGVFRIPWTGWSCLCTACLVLSLTSCDQAARVDAASAPTSTATPAPRDDSTPRPTPTAPAVPSAWQADLLTHAMQVASAMEAKAHTRVKARLQKDVACAAIDVGMIDFAIGSADVIQDWRRGEVLAIAAQALARTGDRQRAEACVANAVQVATGAEVAKQERLNIEIARALALLGHVEQARQFGARASQDLTGQVEAELVTQVPIDELDRQCDAFDRAIATGSFDIVRSGVEGYFRVWAHLRSDGVRSARAERAIRSALVALPPGMQIETYLRLADALQAAGRRDESLQALAAAASLLRGGDFLPDTLGPLVRDVARTQARHGDRAGAGALVREMLQRYEAAPTAMVDIERADYLRPLAEALQDLGEPNEARRVWTLALDAGSVNPNARPRAEDLCLTSLSMVRSGAEPTADMRTRMATIQNGLKAPW